MSPIEKKEKKKNNKAHQTEFALCENLRESILVFFFLLLLSSQIHENMTVGFRRAKNEKCSTRRGLRVGTKNTGFHREFR